MLIIRSFIITGDKNHWPVYCHVSANDVTSCTERNRAYMKTCERYTSTVRLNMHQKCIFFFLFFIVRFFDVGYMFPSGRIDLTMTSTCVYIIPTCIARFLNYKSIMAAGSGGLQFFIISVFNFPSSRIRPLIAIGIST